MSQFAMYVHRVLGMIFGVPKGTMDMPEQFPNTTYLGLPVRTAAPARPPGRPPQVIGSPMAVPWVVSGIVP